MNLTQKILKKHLLKGELVPGTEIAIRIDQTLTQDSTGTMAYLQLEAMGVDRVKTERSMAYIDHNTLQTGFENADDHQYITTVAKKHGIYLSKPGNGICHQVRVCIQKSPPCLACFIAKPLSVFSRNGQDIGPDDPFMRRYFPCDFGEENLFLSCTEKSMRSSLLCARPHRNISDIVFPFVDDYPFSGCDISNEISCMAFGARR